jgi:DNA-binding NtrC family response regulator
LPLSYSIIQSHDGEIRVDSRPGAGTTFTLVLPATPEAPDVPGDVQETAPPGTVRVLVVDDEPSLRKVCQRLIASMGHECATAENSAVALELAEEGDFDIVLCDYRLATETADAVVAGFERVAPHLIERTIIATGATTDSGVVELTRRYNLPLMAKPYGVDELTAIIERAAKAA